MIFIGEKGILMHETYGSKPRLYPDALMQQTAAVPQAMARIERSVARSRVYIACGAMAGVIRSSEA